MGMILPFLMAFLSRLCGASWASKWYPAEIVWALSFGIVSYWQHSSILLTIIAIIISYFAMQLGHGNFYDMKGVNPANDEPESIEKIIRPLYFWSIYKPFYSYVCMGAKGFLIGLPLGILPALVTMVVWPISYAIGFKFDPSETSIAEWANGFVIGVIMSIMIS